MFKTRFSVFVLLLCFCIFLVVPAQIEAQTNTYILYVAPNGNDTWSGTINAPNTTNTDGPLKTITRARDLVRAKKSTGLPSGGAIVYLRGGVYEVTAPIVLTAQDSGTSTTPIVYTRFQNEAVTILGGKKIAGSAFTPYAALPNVLQYNLKANGITSYGKVHPRTSGYYNTGWMELYANKNRMELARHPNAPTWAYTPGENTTITTGKVNVDCLLDCNKYFDAARSGAFIHSWSHDYADFIDVITGSDSAAKNIQFATTTLPINGNRRFFIFNSLNLVDSPGEYYIDRSTGVLFFYPPAPIANLDMFVSASNSIFSFQDASYVKIERLTLEGAIEYAVKIEGGTGIQVAGNVIRNVGTDAVRIMSGNNHLITSNTISNTGDGGVNIAPRRSPESGVISVQDPKNNIVRNNDIYNIQQQIYTYRAGVTAIGNGNLISRNRIRNATGYGVRVGGVSPGNIIELNEISNVVTASSDMGAIYFGENQGDHVVRYNYIHNVDPNSFYTTRGQDPGEGTNAIYLDDFTNNVTVLGNILYKTGRRGIFVNSGSGNKIQNNIILGQHKYGIYMQFRGWVTGRPLSERKPRNNVVTNNYMYNIPVAFRPVDGDKFKSTCNNTAGVDSFVTTCNVCPTDESYTGACTSYPLFFAENTIQNYIGGAIGTADPGVINYTDNVLRAGTSTTITSALSSFVPIPYTQIGIYSDAYRSGPPEGGGGGVVVPQEVSPTKIPTSTTIPTATARPPSATTAPTVPVATPVTRQDIINSLVSYDKTSTQDVNRDGVTNSMDIGSLLRQFR